MSLNPRYLRGKEFHMHSIDFRFRDSIRGDPDII